MTDKFDLVLERTINGDAAALVNGDRLSGDGFFGRERGDRRFGVDRVRGGRLSDGSIAGRFGRGFFSGDRLHPLRLGHRRFKFR